MPVEILSQLKSLRQNVADQLQKDPRFLTLTSLDKSIAEITQVLVQAGALAADAGAHAAPAIPGLSAAAPAPAPAPAPAAAPAPAKRSIAKAALAGAALAAGAAVAVATAGKAQADEAVEDDSSGEDDDAKEDDPGAQREAAAEGSDDEADEEGEARESAPAAAAADERRSEGRAGGYSPMAARPGAAHYRPSASIRFAKLPPTVDMRPHMTPVEDQGQTNSCVANAVAGAYEYWIKKATRQDENVSRLFVYYNARWRDGSQDKDEGSVIQLAMEGLQKFGACPEAVWPFEQKLVLHKPGSEAYEQGAQNRVHDMAQVPMELEAWKQALAEGKPIVFGCALFESFDDCCKRGGVVPMPAPEDVTRGAHGGHSMCAVGYSDAEQVFIVRNSWGADWGDGGYCYMPYDYLLNPKFNDGDSWVFEPRVPLPLPRETWSVEPTVVTNSGRGVDFEISPYRIADYASIVVDLFADTRRPFNTTILSDYSQYVSWSATSQWSSMESYDVETLLSESEESWSESESSSEETSEESEETALLDAEHDDEDDAEADVEEAVDDETEANEEAETDQAAGEVADDEGDAEAEPAALLDDAAEDGETDDGEAESDEAEAELEDVADDEAEAEPEAEAEEAAEEEPAEEDAADEDAADEESDEEPADEEAEEESFDDDGGDDGGDDDGGDDDGGDDDGGDDGGDEGGGDDGGGDDDD